MKKEKKTKKRNRNDFFFVCKHIKFSWGLIIFSLIVKLVLMPATAKAKKSSMKMSRLSPRIKAIQKKYEDDQQKQSEAIQALYKEAMDSKFHGMSRGRRGGRDGSRGQKEVNPVRAEREKLVQKFRKKESEIATYENNIGFFASSKNADALVKEFTKKIEEAKAELAELEEKIKEIDNQFE